MEQKKREKPETLPQSCQINLSDFALFLSVMKVKEAYEDVTEKDDRILDLDKIVKEVKQSEEWEACEGLEISVEEYENAKRQIALLEAGYEETGNDSF